MAVTVAGADEYIFAQCIFVDDWEEAEEPKKQRILNAASRTLSTKYPKYTIPDAAVYEFANVLVQLWNDITRYARQGIDQFAITGVASFSFKNELVTNPDVDLADYIPQSALDIIGEENGVNLSKKAWKWTVM